MLGLKGIHVGKRKHVIIYRRLKTIRSWLDFKHWGKDNSPSSWRHIWMRFLEWKHLIKVHWNLFVKGTLSALILENVLGIHQVRNVNWTNKVIIYWPMHQYASLDPWCLLSLKANKNTTHFMPESIPVSNKHVQQLTSILFFDTLMNCRCGLVEHSPS